MGLIGLKIPCNNLQRSSNLSFNKRNIFLRTSIEPLSNDAWDSHSLSYRQDWGNEAKI
jgi:hypothetical protein